jgi:hypothetical protein
VLFDLSGFGLVIIRRVVWKLYSGEDLTSKYYGELLLSYYLACGFSKEGNVGMV